MCSSSINWHSDNYAKSCFSTNFPCQLWIKYIILVLLEKCLLTFARQFIQGIDNRFDNYGSTVYLISELVPSVLVERNLKVKKRNRAVSRWSTKAYLRKRRTFPMEKKMGVRVEKRSSIHYCLVSEACERDMYLNFHVLLIICPTIPVISCECKRSGSALKPLHTYLRASIGQTRVSALALLHNN